MTSVVYRIAKSLNRRRTVGDAGLNPATFNTDDYRAWRERSLVHQYSDNFSLDHIRGKDVLDFGCGTGELSHFVANAGARCVIGIDLAPESIAKAVRNAPPHTFFLVGDPQRVELPIKSVDTILCFDVMEHVMNYEEIIIEWRRVLRPGGRVLIWWVPWYHPYGHHIESLVPVPWAHVIFSDATLIEACAQIYDDPDFVPRQWDLDVFGNKKPNKWRNMTQLPGVNRLTTHRFEQVCKEVGFTIARRTARPISRLNSVPVAKKLIERTPLRECLASCVCYELVR